MNEDCISREETVKSIKELFDMGECHCDEYSIVGAINQMPSIQPKSKTGHWTRVLIRNERGGCIGAKMICSECDSDNRHDEYMNYCPNCGADMRG